MHAPTFVAGERSAAKNSAVAVMSVAVGYIITRASSPQTDITIIVPSANRSGAGTHDSMEARQLAKISKFLKAKERPKS